MPERNKQRQIIGNQPAGNLCHTITVMVADAFIQCRMASATKALIRALPDQQQVCSKLKLLREVARPIGPAHGGRTILTDQHARAVREPSVRSPISLPG